MNAGFALPRGLQGPKDDPELIFFCHTAKKLLLVTYCHKTAETEVSLWTHTHQTE